MNTLVLGFRDIDASMTPLVGGKGANLGELSRIRGVLVPDGFCVTTEAYRHVVTRTPGLPELLDRLTRIGLGARGEDATRAIAEAGGEIRRTIEAAPIPAAVAEAVGGELAKLGADQAYAVRSSATAEDLASASFAGQQDTYLNLVGREALLDGIRRCWASLFTDRAVTYRIQNGFDHRDVLLAVVVQRMVFPRTAGVMFTADPITSDRRTVSIDAGYGLGEAVVSGLVTADNYKVRDDRIVDKTISTKKLAIYPDGDQGVIETEVTPDRQDRQALTDRQILDLAGVGKRIEAHYGNPQDTEWCMDERGIFIVQSRPITTLYPVPTVTDGHVHVYISFSHQQMMTDAMKPLGLSFFQRGFPDVPLVAIGGRLYLDVSTDLRSAVGRKVLLASMKSVDPLIHNALERLVSRDGFIASLPRGKRALRLGTGYFSWSFLKHLMRLSRSDDASLVPQAMAENDAAVGELRRRLAGLTGEALLTRIEHEQRLIQQAIYDAHSMSIVYVGILASRWIDKHVEKWLGEKGTANTLSMSVDHNITSEMGLDLVDVADVVRRHPEVVDYLREPDPRTFLDDLARLPGGDETTSAVQRYLDRYGMRCPGEIDITRPRFAENPSALTPMILADIRTYEPGARAELFARGLRTARDKEQDILARLERLPGGRRKAKRTKRKIAQLRAFIGYREYPKYMLVQRYWVIKQALLREAERLQGRGAIRDVEDVFYLSFDELRDAIRTGRVDEPEITRRRQDHVGYARLTPPRVMTSDGEEIFAEYEAGGVPEGALKGLPASSGIVEGRARVVTSLDEANFGDDDILVTTYTDPSWTPAFVSVKGLVTEVGGMMTHGSVVAREYGLPAVVGVQNATTLIRDGDRVRVNGNDGWVRVLNASPAQASDQPRTSRESE
ncbi:rifamycin-inactivating phosphotransferase [Thermopolyspora sp. NPDC052614]|uniref:rifamycin-inactivating phosphotransferase n=1 Tax=Thermopolyspora sp. NPDC052614 TaxID=3155682 RepID=UPI003431AA76